MSDLVSRQEVIEVIDAVMPVDPNKSEYASGIACGAALAMTYVKQLPSAQQEVRTEMSSADTISRQAAIDALKRLQKDISGDYTELDPMVMAGCGYIGDCIGELECLPSAQPEPKWIPCSERLPEEKDTRILKKLGINKQSDHVLATVKVKGECMTVQACTYDGVWNWDMKHAFPDCEIIAWMPLPEPARLEND